MTGDELRTWYLSLPDSSKLIFLALVSEHLTIHGRGLGLDLTGGTFQQALLGLNELQHQISDEIVDLGLGRDKGSTDILWEILQEEALSSVSDVISATRLNMLDLESSGTSCRSRLLLHHAPRRVVPQYRCGKEQGINTIQHPAMSWKDPSRVFHSRTTLDQ